MSFKGSAAEQVAVLQHTTATASSTPLVSTAAHLRYFNKALVIFRLGDMAAETIDISVQTCDSDGSNAAALKSATQLGASASANDNGVVVIAVETNELAASGKQHIRGRIVTGGATGGTCTILVLGLEPREAPVDDDDVATVLQVIP